MRLLPALAVVALVGAGCGQEPQRGPTRQAPGTVLVEGEAANDRGAVQVRPGDDVEVEVGDFYFAPTVLLGSPGTEVTVRFVSRSELGHNVSLAELSIDEEIGPRQAVDVVVTFPQSGTTVFFCAYHRDRAMLGALVAG